MQSLANAEIKRSVITEDEEINKEEITEGENTENTDDSEQKEMEKEVEISSVEGVVKGAENLNFYLDLVPVDSLINKGDVLYTSSLEKTFPRGLLIGKITKVNKNDQKPFQQAELEPFLVLNGVNNLFVITNYKQPN